MRCIRVVFCEVDDQTPDTMTELAAFDLPTLERTTLAPETALDDLERTTYETGAAILRRTLQARWDLLDAALAEQYRQGFSPSTQRRQPHHRKSR
jgi:hypothetical protein